MVGGGGCSREKGIGVTAAYAFYFCSSPSKFATRGSSYKP